MPHLVVSERASYDLLRLRQFLLNVYPQAAANMADKLDKEVDALLRHPRLGRLITDPPETRELVIRFGKAAYSALYTLDGEQITLRAFKHSREAGY